MSTSRNHRSRPGWSSFSGGDAVYRVPTRCKFCGAPGAINAEATIVGSAVALRWCCRACREEWPVTRGDRESPRAVQPRRATSADRKRKR